MNPRRREKTLASQSPRPPCSAGLRCPAPIGERPLNAGVTAGETAPTTTAPMNHEHFIALDCETGGLNSAEDALLSIAAVPSWAAAPFEIYLIPVGRITAKAVETNGYTPEFWASLGAVTPKVAALELQRWLYNLEPPGGGYDMAAHNAGFDSLFISALRERTGIDIEIPGIWHCTKIKLQELREEGILPPGSNHLDDLGNLSGYWKTDPRGTTHEALQDARCCRHGLHWLRSLSGQKKERGGAAA